MDTDNSLREFIIRQRYKQVELVHGVRSDVSSSIEKVRGEGSKGVTIDAII